MYSKFISSFNNSILINRDFFYLNKSKKHLKLLNFFLRESLIKNYKVVENNLIKIFLVKRNNIFLIKHIKQISKNSKSIYIKSNRIKLKINTNDIISTNKGLMLDFKAKKLQLGGQIICKIVF